MLAKTETSNYQNIADEIRAVNHSEQLYYPAQMAEAIRNSFERLLEIEENYNYLVNGLLRVLGVENND